MEGCPELLMHLQSIRDSIDCLNDPSVLDVASFVILALSLGFLMLYTGATQRMKEEMVRQRKMSNAHDVSFRMGANHYLPENPDKQNFGEIRMLVSNNNISEFNFLDGSSRPIGRATSFCALTQESRELLAFYRIDSREDRQRFLKTLNNQRGFIKAKVAATSGDKFLYTYKAVQGNYKKAESKPNLNDQFRLVGKEIFQKQNFS